MPNAQRAIVEPARLRDYLVPLRHKAGRSKARFFLATHRARSMASPDRAKAPRTLKLDDDAHRRTLGRRLAPDLPRRARTGAGPTPEEIGWVRAMANYRTRVPKGVFRYRSHEEANADWERWHAELVAETARQRKRGPGR